MEEEVYNVEPTLLASLTGSQIKIYCVDIINNMLKKVRYIFFYIILIFKPIMNKLINIKSLL